LGLHGQSWNAGRRSDKTAAMERTGQQGGLRPSVDGHNPLVAGKSASFDEPAEAGGGIELLRLVRRRDEREALRATILLTQALLRCADPDRLGLLAQLHALAFDPLRTGASDRLQLGTLLAALEAEDVEIFGLLALRQ